MSAAFSSFSFQQVPVLVGDVLLVSVIPKDVGRPTSRLDRGFVDGNGICCWEKPVYETVRFIRDPKTGKFNQKIYYFIVSTVSSSQYNWVTFRTSIFSPFDFFFFENCREIRSLMLSVKFWSILLSMPNRSNLLLSPFLSKIRNVQLFCMYVFYLPAIAFLSYDDKLRLCYTTVLIYCTRLQFNACKNLLSWG